MDAKTSPLCCKCNSDTGNFIYCFWKCVKLQKYWSDIVKELCAIFGVSIDLDPMCLLLGFPDRHIVNANHKRLFNLLTFATRKNMLFCFFGPKTLPPQRSPGIIVSWMIFQMSTFLAYCTPH